MIIKIILPTPPSINSYWQHGRSGHTYLSVKAKQFRQNTIDIVSKTKYFDLKTNKRLIYICDYFPPDRRTRDLDNIHKSIMDGLTHAGVYIDDSQIDEMHCYRKQIVKKGKVEITLIEVLNIKRFLKIGKYIINNNIAFKK